MKLILYAIVLSILLSSCCKDNCSIEPGPTGPNTCATFDMRQCSGNPWLGQNNAIPDSDTLHREALREYLEYKNIFVSAVFIDNDFHTMVCEACFVCPQGLRYEVLVIANDTSKLKNLELLNLAFEPCIH